MTITLSALRASQKNAPGFLQLLRWIDSWVQMKRMLCNEKTQLNPVYFNPYNLSQ